MSYAGPSRARGTARTASSSAAGRPASPRRGAPLSPSPSPGETDWQQVAIFGAGVALGIAVGAGAALLAAPRTGAETRAVLRARAGRVGRSTSRRGHDAWDDLRDEIRGVTRALQRRKARRAAARDLRREAELEVAVD
jgi:gas vesicle protein